MRPSEFDPEDDLRQRQDEGEGLDPTLYAWADCELCGGSGYLQVAEAEGGDHPEMCGCVLERQRRHACEQRVFSLFGPGGSRMTLASYHPGSSEGPRALRPMDVQLNQAAFQTCLNYVAYFEQMRQDGVGFALQGPPGAGKTHLLTGTLIALIKRYSTHEQLLDAFCLSVPEMLDLARQRFNDSSVEDVIEHAKTADITLLDDIGAEYHKGTDHGGMSWVDERLYVILNYRLQHNLPTLYSTNLRKAELAQTLDGRIMRRLDDKTAAFLELRANPGAPRGGQKPELVQLLAQRPERRG